MRRTSYFLKQCLMLIMVIVSLYPIYFMLITSLKTKHEYIYNIIGFPNNPSFSEYTSAIKNIPLITWFENSIILTITSVCLTVLISTLAAYAIACGKFAGKELLLKINVALMIVPPAALTVPMFFLVVKLGLINTLSSVIIFYTGLTVPFSVFLLTGFFKEVPKDLFEAANIDGCSSFGILWKIVLPLSASAFMTLVVVNSLYIWNELLIAIVFLQDENLRTLMAGISLSQGRYSTNQPLIMAASFLSMLPILLLYLFGQKFFIRGLTAGISK